MTSVTLVLLAATFVQCPDCYLQCPECSVAANFSPIQNPADVQRQGIELAVKELNNQIKILSESAGQEPRLMASHPDKDQQTAVMNLADAMENNGLLTRVYLALAVAELKLVTLPCCLGCCSESDKKKYLRHAEAIQYAIDGKNLDAQDLRVFRVLQAGVNEALREELSRLQSSPMLVSNTTYQACVRRRRVGVLTCGMKCR